VVAWIAIRKCPEAEARFDLAEGRIDPAAFVRFDGWRPTPEGLVAPPGEKCIFSLPCYKSRFQEVFLDVETTESGRGKIEIAMVLPPEAKAAQNTVPKTPSEDAPWRLTFGVPWQGRPATSLVGTPEGVDLTRLWPESGECLLFAYPVEGASGPLLRAIKIQRRINPLSLLVLAFFLPVVHLSAWHLALAFPRFSPGRVTVSLATLPTLLCCFTLPDFLDIMLFPAICSATAAVLALLLKKKDMGVLAPILVALLTFLGASLRWDYLNEMRFEPPTPDAVGYREIAKAMSFFYDSDMREPLFILFVKASLGALGDGDTPLRVVSYLFSVLLIPALYRVGKALFTPTAGVIAAAILASNSAWAWNGARGLRLELFTLALLALTWAIFAPRPPSLRKHAAWLGLASAGVCLVQLASLWFCLAGAAYALWRRGWNTRAFALSTSLTLAPVVPYLVYCGVKFGDPLYTVNLHVKHFRNQEYVEQGRLTAEEMARDPYGGSRTNAVRYFFLTQPPGELLARTVRAFTDIVFGTHAWERVADGSRLLYWWSLWSYLAVVCSRHRTMLVWLICLVGPIAWLYGKGFGPEPRHVMHVSVLTYCFMADAVVRVARYGLGTEPTERPAPTGVGDA
jgi:hypothetical protein